MTQELYNWSQVERENTNQFEVTDIEDVDIGFGNYLGRIISTNSVKRINRRAQGAEHFFTAPLGEVLFLGEYEEPKRFLRALAGSERARKTEVAALPDSLKSSINKRALPVMYYFRNKGIIPTDKGEESLERDVIVDDEGKVSLMSADVSYSVFILAHDMASIDRIANAFVMAFNFDSRHFSSSSSLAGRPFELDAQVKEHATIGFDDYSVPSTEGRLYAYMANVPVQTHIARIEYQTEKTVNYSVREPEAIR